MAHSLSPGACLRVAPLDLCLGVRRVRTTYYLLHTTHCLLLTPDYVQLTAYQLPLSTDYLLQTAYCLLLATCCLLLATVVWPNGK